jgi:hypothetical protein
VSIQRPVNELSAAGCHSAEPNYQAFGTLGRVRDVFGYNTFRYEKLDTARKGEFTADDGTFGMLGRTHQEHTISLNRPVFRLEKFRFGRVRSYYS